MPIPQPATGLAPQTLLVLGANGDLTRRLLLPGLGTVTCGGCWTPARGAWSSTVGRGDLPAYGQVLERVFAGDPTLSVRGDTAVECWRIIEPVLAAWRAGAVPLEGYAAGSEGPP